MKRKKKDKMAAAVAAAAAAPTRVSGNSTGSHLHRAPRWFN